MIQQTRYKSAIFLRSHGRFLQAWSHILWTLGAILLLLCWFLRQTLFLSPHMLTYVPKTVTIWSAMGTVKLIIWNLYHAICYFILGGKDINTHARIHAHTQNNTHRQRYRHRQTDRHIHAHRHTDAHTWTHTHEHTYMNTHTHEHTYMNTHKHTHTFLEQKQLQETRHA